MIEGIDIPDEDYFKRKGISKSLLSRMDCPEKAFTPYKSTPAMLEGSAVHCAILEPNEFESRYVVEPTINKRTNVGKEEYAAFVEANKNKTVITQDLVDMALIMQDAVMSHVSASRLLSGGKAEQAYFWTDERTQAECKCKADYVQGNVIVDLKTTNDASPGGFSRAVANFKYHWQDAWYTRGTKADGFIFVAVEKPTKLDDKYGRTVFSPCIVEVYELDVVAKQLGAKQVDEALDRYLWHRDMEEIKGYTGNQDIVHLSLPAWASK